MNAKNWFRMSGVAFASLIMVAGSLAIAEPSKDTPPDFQLPPGWTAEDLHAVMAAGTPGEMHKLLAKEVGEWKGTTKMWMVPDSEPAESKNNTSVKPMMDGRYIQCEMHGDMPGMGPYHGLGIYGYDNLAKKFTCTWIDNHGTSAMNGEGELSKDGTSIHWKFPHICPLTGKPTVMRQIETLASPKTKSIEFFSIDPKSGKEYKMMVIDLTRKD